MEEVSVTVEDPLFLADEHEVVMIRNEIVRMRNAVAQERPSTGSPAQFRQGGEMHVLDHLLRFVENRLDTVEERVTE